MAWQACALYPEALASGCRPRGGSRPQATAARRPSPVQTRRKHAKFPGPARSQLLTGHSRRDRLTRSNDGQIPRRGTTSPTTGHLRLATGTRRRAPGGEADLAGAVVAGGPLYRP